MDPVLIRAFQMQITSQCQYVLWAVQTMNESVASIPGKDLDRDRAVERLFWALQDILTAAANISKACWGSGGRKEDERADLRASIGIRDDSTLRNTDMRNNYDHFDERLDDWWRDCPRHNMVDRNMMPPSAIAGFDQKEVLRNYDPTSRTAYFWGQKFDIQAIISEVEHLYPIVRAAAYKDLLPPEPLPGHPV